VEFVTGVSFIKKCNTVFASGKAEIPRVTAFEKKWVPVGESVQLKYGHKQ
jgi:hypothetical protein